MAERQNTKPNFTSGLVSGSLSVALFYPIDILRLRWFYGKNIGSFNTLYNGLMFTVVAGGIKNMGTYPTRDYLKQQCIKYKCDSKSTILYSNIGTGVIIGMIGNPINNIKVHFQANKTRRTTFSIVNNIYGRYGIYGFYRGGVGTFGRDIGWASTYFTCYDFINAKINHNIYSSLAAGTVSMCVAYPFDGMRLYRQHHQNDYNLWHGFRESFKLSKSNMKSFGISLIRIPLATTFSHMSYLYLAKMYN